jgi:hypothetical protein
MIRNRNGFLEVWTVLKFVPVGKPAVIRNTW